MGVKIYPRRVIDRANVTDRELDCLAGHVRGIRASLGMLGNVGRLSLKGQAWDSARSYVEEVEMPYINTKLQWIEAMKNGNTRFRSEAQRLPGVNCLDKDLLEEEFDYWEDRLDREYDREHPRSSVISRCRRMIRDINSKLVAIDIFVQATGGIYDRATGIQNILDRADTEIKKVSYNPQTNEIQFTTISAICLKGLEQVDVMEAVKVTGLSEEQIQEAMEYGFTVQEVCSAWTAVQNSKKKKWRHDVVELLYVAGKAERLESVDWKEVVHSSKEDLQEIYDWIRQEKENELIHRWLSPGYKMSNKEIDIAKDMIEEFRGGEGLFSDNPELLEVIVNKWNDLKNKVDSTNLLTGLISVGQAMIETKITDEVVEAFSDSLFSFLRYNTTAFMDEGLVAVTTSGVNVVVSQTPSLLKQFVRLGATKGLPIIGGVFDYVIMSAQGEELGDAVVKATAHAVISVGAGAAGAKIGLAVGAAIGSIIPGAGTAAGAAIGGVIGGGIGFVGGIFGSKAFDDVWDNREELGEKVSEVADTIKNKLVEASGNIIESLKGFVSGFNCLGSVFG
jgi:hypothetical protein